MDSPADRRARGLKPLDEARAGERLEVVSVFERDRKLLEFLDGVGIKPGVVVEVVHADGAIELLGGVRIERPIAARLWGR